MPRVYNKRKSAPAEYRNPPPDAVLVDRTTEWGNLFKIGRDGTRAEVIAKYEALVHQAICQNPDWLAPLRGKDLICWCFPKACHADVLLRMANDTIRSFVVRSNRVSSRGFRVVLCEGNMSADGTIRLTFTGNNIIDESTGQRTRVDLCSDYASLDALLAALETQNVRCIYWHDTKEYLYINKR